MRRICVVLCIFLFAALTAESQVVWDFGPTSGTVDGSCWSNSVGGQNFADDFSFTEPMTLTGIDIWSCTSFGASTAHIKILLDDGAGNPGAVFSEWDQAVASTLDGPGWRISATFAGVSLSAGQIYWIGMSPNTIGASQHSLSPSDTPGDGTMAQFSGSTFSHHAAVGDQVYQLSGGLTAVEVPDLSDYGIATLVLLMAAAGFIAVRRVY